MIPYGKQDISKEDVKSVIDVLNSDFLTQGPVLPKFENKVAKYCDSRHAVASNSATSSLHLACLALGLESGDWLWTSPNSFVASANCGIYCGANVDFVDIDPQTYNMCPNKLEEKLAEAEKAGKLPKIVIPVHYAGQSCDMKKIFNLSLKYNFKIIEDASHSIGGSYLDLAIGNCKYSEITIFSFHPVKIVTTAEGGVATTNSDEISNTMKLLRSHGITRDPSLMTKKPDGAWYYQQIQLGFNYRMSEIHAALGISQLNRLDEFVTRRQTIRDTYDTCLDGLPLIKPFQSKDCISSMHLYPIQINKELYREKLFNELRSNGIGVNVHYIPIHMQPYYQKLGFKENDFPNAKFFYERAISLPIYFGLTEEKQKIVISTLKQIFAD